MLNTHCRNLQTTYTQVSNKNNIITLQLPTNMARCTCVSSYSTVLRYCCMCVRVLRYTAHFSNRAIWPRPSAISAHGAARLQHITHTILSMITNTAHDCRYRKNCSRALNARVSPLSPSPLGRVLSRVELRMLSAPAGLGGLGPRAGGEVPPIFGVGGRHRGRLVGEQRGLRLSPHARQRREELTKRDGPRVRRVAGQLRAPVAKVAEVIAERAGRQQAGADRTSLFRLGRRRRRRRRRW